MEAQNYDNINSKKRKELREAYVKEQGGKCSHCSQDLDKSPCASVRNRPIDESLFPPYFLSNPVHLHHSHETGMTIGAVHAYCNAVLWQYYGE